MDYRAGNTRNITYLTAGAAGMFCGSCMHDNTLARALNSAGCQTMLVPTYTPIRTDESDVTVDEIFFGGINVYLQQKIPIFRVVPKLLDRFLDNPWLIRKVTSRGIETDAKLLGGLTVSMLKGNHGYQKKEVARLVDWLRKTAHPDVLILSNILIAGFVKSLKQELDVPVIVTLQGDDIFLNSLEEPYKSQSIELIGQIDQHVDSYLVHSQFYADWMASFLKLDRNKMRITPLGIDTADFESIDPDRDKPRDDQRVIGYLARLTEDKGLHLLVDAFMQLSRDGGVGDVNLCIAGWLGKDHEEYAQQQFKKLDDAGLKNKYRYLGEIDRQQKIEMLMSIDLLSVPTVYREPKGLYALEAMAAGIPVVQPAHGVFPEMINHTEGGRLFEALNVSELSNQLKKLLLDDELRKSMGRRGREAVLTSRNARNMALATLEVINEIVPKKHTL